MGWSLMLTFVTIAGSWPRFQSLAGSPVSVKTPSPARRNPMPPRGGSAWR
jgi:hypothetical protein